jgi:hypothetical protein
MTFSDKQLYQAGAIASFLVSFILYMITLEPTASFWDCGEFIAVAHGLQVTHPPGAPLFLLIGRMFTMFMPPDLVAYAMNTMSALTSALTVMFLFSITVKLIKRWKDAPETWTSAEKWSVFGGAFIGAVAFAVSDTFWFSAVEAEVYALSMFFTALVVWMPLKWAEIYPAPHHNRWLLLIAYMFGLALGVHLLNILALFFVALIVYYERTSFTWPSFVIMGILTVVGFFTVYPFVVTGLPTAAESVSEATYGLIGPVLFMTLVIIAVAFGVYYTHKKGKSIANLVFLGYLFILLGYTSYALVLIRSAADPPIDENDPETASALVSYLKREQYGETKLFKGPTFNNELGTIDRSKDVFFPRRYSPEGRHIQKYAEYSSDAHFFWSYQMDHMYFRYFMWNFSGRDSDVQDAAWLTGLEGETGNESNKAHNRYFQLPFLLGMFGLFFHFAKDGKRALAVGVLFVVTGVAIVVFLNQYPFQPRERDYAYVGSFFAFAIWIGIGASALIDELRRLLQKMERIVAPAGFFMILIAVPGIMLQQNYDDHDRSNRYVAPDYAYNLLNSCAPYAILFTNGDNDTFPLWYLQEVEGVRQDVRVVCLSLLNTPWYIKQLKNQWSHNSPPLPISLPDEVIDNLERKFEFKRAQDFWTPKEVVVPVDKNLIKNRHQLPDGMTADAGIDPRDPNEAPIDVYSPAMDFEMDVDSFDNEVRWYYEGRFLGEQQKGQKLYYTYIQDDLVMDIIKTNQWIRPVYFATTVSYDGQIGMQDYFRLEGQAFRVVPKRFAADSQFGYVDPSIHGKRLRSFQFRNVDREDVYFDENIRRLLDNYRTLITKQSQVFMTLNQPDSAVAWLRWGEAKIPFKTVEADLTNKITYAYRYAKAGSAEDAMRIASEIEPEMMKDLTDAMEMLNRIEQEIYAMEQDAKRARADGNTSAERSLRNAMRSLAMDRYQVMENVNYGRSRLVLLQSTFYLSGRDDLADGLTKMVASVGEGRLPFPASRAESDEQAARLRID